MHLDRRIRIQLVVYAVITLVAGVVMGIGYIQLPELFGVGRYSVTVELPRAAGLYPRANVTYRGTEVGQITEVQLTDTGVEAVLSLRSDVAIPSDLEAEVHSVSSVGEQYVALLPRDGNSAALKNGDVIPVSRATVPPDINGVVESLNSGLQAVPRENLKTVVDESYIAVGGLGPELARFVQGSTTVITDARKNLDAITALIDQSAPVLDSQSETADAISAWAARLAAVTDEMRVHDTAVAKLLEKGAAATDEGRQLFERLQPTLPILMANLVSLGDVAVAYQPNIEQTLVLLPQATAELQGASLASHGTKEDYKGTHVDFNLNVNVPPPCTTGYLPAQQRRAAAAVDYPDPTGGDVYCRIPQDSDLAAVRGARNTPCATVPGKRAATSRCAKATSSTSRSTRAPIGRATRMPHCRGKRSPNCRPARRHRRRRPLLWCLHHWRWPNMTRPQAHTWARTESSTRRQTWHKTGRTEHGRACLPPRTRGILAPNVPYRSRFRRFFER
jgi:phospholipid/cholesterol/gamma-HCH transport system substrate-binding protein